MIEIGVPTIKDDLDSVDHLFGIFNQVKDAGFHARLNLSKCRSLHQNALALFCGMARIAEARGGKLEFVRMTKTVSVHLTRSGFLSALGMPVDQYQIGWNAIPLREDSVKNSDEIINYLKDKWLGRGWVRVSDRVRDAIVGRVWETYENAFDHAKSDVGVFTCGQHFPKLRKLALAVADFGTGIPAGVRAFFSDRPQAKNYRAASCLKWAFQRGTSTKPGGRGVGLDILKDFVRINDGTLEVFSNEGYVLIDQKQERYEERKTAFDGTLVNVILRCDARFYSFPDEDDPDGSKSGRRT